MSVRIILVDDHKMVRDGLRCLLAQENDLEVVAEAENGNTAVLLCARHAPQLVIMDIAMPSLNGIEATRQIIAHDPHCKVIALSSHADRRFIAQVLKAGASGYLLKESAFEELASAIRAVLNNKTYLSPAVSEIVVDDYLQLLERADGSAFTLLSPREREVLQLLAEGTSTSQIADRLCLSVKTVETHRQHIMEKLNLHSVAELTKYAIREGLTSL
jgi:DNA-binding NarL/FixJ family response regulator